MTVIRRLSSILAFTTTTVIALIYNFQISPWYALLIIFLGVLWYRLGSDHLLALHAGFLSFCLLISLGVLRYGISIWFIIAMHSALALWDLLALNIRLENSDATQDYRMIAKRHLDRLGFAIAASLGLSLLTLYLRANLSLIGIIVCGLVVMAALSSAIKLLHRDSA
ncbi:MAG: hypothetical protein E4H27_05965 [Anaerolineales bacterium]|nr:MAG: hypothetical protein E4H27_05965 [Anaerolineales bacterium]